jgi:DNA adenine methylase
MEAVLRWAGGKRQLWDELDARIPKKIDTYFEPFIGGGATFFALAKQGRFKSAVIGDVNADLVLFYHTLRDYTEALIDEIARLDQHRSRNAFGGIRDAFNEGDRRAPVIRSAQLYYLNKTCFNGLYRVNRAGKFNVPSDESRFKRSIFDKEALALAALALQDVTIVHGDYQSCFWGPLGAGDFTYYDPPYLPVSKTANFAHYQKDAFGEEQTFGLATWCAANHTHSPFLLSNADTPKTRELFGAFGFQIESVSARRNINSKGGKRGAVGEILVSNKKE